MLIMLQQLNFAISEEANESIYQKTQLIICTQIVFFNFNDPYWALFSVSILTVLNSFTKVTFWTLLSSHGLIELKSASRELRIVLIYKI